MLRFFKILEKTYLQTWHLFSWGDVYERMVADFRKIDQISTCEMQELLHFDQ